MNVLVLNSGSSSLKFQVIATDLDRIRNTRTIASAAAKWRALVARPSSIFSIAMNRAGG